MEEWHSALPVKKMKILLIEDNCDKEAAISIIINERLQDLANSSSITVATDLATARRNLISTQYDLVIFDMYLPDICGLGNERDCSQELIVEFSKSKNYKSEAITLTQFDVSEIDDIHAFNTAGITLVKYDDGDDWKSALKLKLDRAAQKIKCDFLIFCALAKERSAFRNAKCTVGPFRKVAGIDCMDIKVDDFHGLIIKPQEMGLVSMAITASKAIELFQPKVVSMSGICAGVKGEANYLDILVGKLCWEYQTGKWKDGEFKQEPYPVEVHSDLTVDLDQSQESYEILNDIRHGLYDSALANMKIRFSPISSGSAVIADEEMMRSIGMQHRKMAGLEMEMYSMYEAAKQSLCRPLYFGAKVVVDMGDSSKGDLFHETGCTLAARYVTTILRQKLKELPE
ncbi:hypothetical protein [Vibrio alginolyticus]|uniref:hypothetical protein n=1 Tax=Vibrio alginolyticus TaxID=663 RepID=UPI000A40C40E|nr:hypothetical protein [Vibrio alginolyticus]